MRLVSSISHGLSLVPAVRVAVQTSSSTTIRRAAPYALTPQPGLLCCGAPAHRPRITTIRTRSSMAPLSGTPIANEKTTGSTTTSNGPTFASGVAPRMLGAC